jgi:hypothetical protein
VEKVAQRVLYGVYALVQVPRASEEGVFLPVLQPRLTPAAAQLIEEVEAAGHGEQTCACCAGGER